MRSWIDDLRSRCGPLSDAALNFTAHHSLERDPPSGAAGLLLLAGCVEELLDRDAGDDELERRFVEGAGSYLGLLLCKAMPEAHHTRVGERHGLAFGARAFFDPFAAIERVLEADDVRASLAEQVALCERNARRETPALEDVRDHILPRLVGPSLLAEVRRQVGGHALYSRPFVGEARLMFLVREADRGRYVTEPELARWGTTASQLLRLALANLARDSDRARLFRIEHDDGVLIAARTGDGLDSSRVLLPGLHDVLAPELGSAFAVAIPHRDALFACALEKPATLRLLRERAAAECARSRYAITPDPLVCEPGGRLRPLV